MTDEVFGRDTTVYWGQGANVLALQQMDRPVRGNMTVEHAVTSTTENLAGQALVQHFAQKIDVSVNFDRIVWNEHVSVARLLEWWAGFSATADADIGEMAVLGPGNVVTWPQNVFPADVTVTTPNDNLVALSGTPGQRDCWVGTAGTRFTIKRGALTPSAAGQVTYAEDRDGVGGIVALTEARAGTHDLLFQYKRGRAAWAAMSRDAHAEALPTVTTAGSAVRLDTSELETGDLVRVAFSNTVDATSEWTGRLAACTPPQLT